MSSVRTIIIPRHQIETLKCLPNGLICVSYRGPNSFSMTPETIYFNKIVGGYINPNDGGMEICFEQYFSPSTYVKSNKNVVEEVAKVVEVVEVVEVAKVAKVEKVKKVHQPSPYSIPKALPANAEIIDIIDNFIGFSRFVNERELKHVDSKSEEGAGFQISVKLVDDVDGKKRLAFYLNGEFEGFFTKPSGECDLSLLKSESQFKLLLPEMNLELGLWISKKCIQGKKENAIYECKLNLSFEFIEKKGDFNVRGLFKRTNIELHNFGNELGAASALAFLRPLF